VKVGSTAAIVDANGNTWTITASDQVAVNGTADATTANVIELAYVNGEIWQENSNELWWGKTSPAAAWSPSTGTSTSPLSIAPIPTPSANDASVLAGSAGAITDAAGDSWTISSANTVLENGTAAGFTANVTEIAYVNGTVWHENTSGQWYSWTGSMWDAGNDPLPAKSTEPTPTPTPSPTPAPSPTPKPSANDTVVLAGSTSAIIDATENQWTISPTDTVLEDGEAAGFTANVAEIAYVDGTMWHENAAGEWYSWTGAAWEAGNDPLPAATGLPTPTPTPSPIPAPSPSANDTVVLAGSGSAITDAADDQWTISTANAVLENGSPAGFSANVAEIAYVNGTVWQENTSSQWYSWTGSAWDAGTDPLPTSGSTAGSGSAAGGVNALGSELNLSGYHLTFDWEANSFPNSPTPQAGSFTTTLSSGLRYLDNGDQEYWADSSTGQNPFELDNGVLDINATYIGAGNTPGGGSLSYVSGVFTTQGWFSQQYGYFEMRAELPAGAGMWPAFWMLDNNSDQPGGWPPELDALEAFGAPNADGEGGPNQAHWDVHSQNASQQAGGWVTLDANETTGFHTYGVLWTPATMSFVYDGQIEAQAPTPSDYTQAMYMIVDLAVGGTWPGDATGENGTMKIDYLRAFSSNSAIPAVALQTVSSPDGGGTSLYGATTATSVGTPSALVSSHVSMPYIASLP